jgi:xanthine dehydrogenase accessory factor
MADAQPRMVVVDLTNDIALTTDGVCGGIMDIFVEPWSPPTNGHDVASGVLEAVTGRRIAVTATVIDVTRGLPCGLGEKLLIVDGQLQHGSFGSTALTERVQADAPGVAASGKSQVRTYAFGEEEASVYFDLALPKPTLIVVGAGHVAVPIAQVGRLLDFDVVVVDDRASFASKDRFPTADRIIVDAFESAVDDLPITPSTYVVLVTRGHAHDVHALRRIVQKPAAYIGMIGSRRRVYAVFKLLRDEGVPVEDLLRVHAPIGLDIKTETPGEIAISVGAELLKVRRGGGAASMSDLLRAQYQYSLTRNDADL